LHYQKQSACSLQSLSKFLDILHRDRKINPKVYMETQKTSNILPKQFLNKKSNAGGITTPNFKLFYRVTTIKASWY
jgi:hypothetical protein